MKKSIAAAGLCAAFSVFAQAPIERVKMSDADLSCAQLHAEAGDMDKAAADARAAEAQGNNTATAGTVGSVAADVGSRSGLFGQLGGLAGHLIGTVGSQAAAGAARSSGQATAQQAAERGRQAMARKEHVSTLFINKGCKANDLAYNPPAPPAGSAPAPIATAAPGVPAAAPVPVAVTALPELDPDGFFKGQTGGTFGKNVVEVLPANKRVAVTGFRVAFITSNTVSAQVRASYLPGRDTSGASSTLVVGLSGVDNATLQSLTDKAYADFLAQLKLAGREVVPPEQLQEFLSGVEATPAPYSKTNGGQSGLVFAPRGVPLWFSHADVGWTDKGAFDQANLRRLADHAQRMNAIVIAPLLVVNFARMSSSGNTSGLTSRSVETGAEMSMMVTSVATHFMRSDESRNGLVMKGDEGRVASTRAFISELKFGAMKEVAASDNKAVKSAFDVLGAAMGMANAGGAARSKSENVAETSNAAFSAAASDALVRATGTFAKLFQKYPAAN